MPILPWNEHKVPTECHFVKKFPHFCNNFSLFFETIFAAPMTKAIWDWYWGILGESYAKTLVLSTSNILFHANEIEIPEWNDFDGFLEFVDGISCIYPAHFITVLNIDCSPFLFTVVFYSSISKNQIYNINKSILLSLSCVRMNEEKIMLIEILIIILDTCVGIGDWNVLMNVQIHQIIDRK